jgi:hypothetical protein
MTLHQTSHGELLAMPIEDLRKDILTQRALIARSRLGIQLNKEKDTAKYRRDRRMLARMLAAMQTLQMKASKEKTIAPLKSKRKSRTIPASST